MEGHYTIQIIDELLQEQKVIAELPKKIKEEVIVSLASGDFQRAKQLHDDWKSNQASAVQ